MWPLHGVPSQEDCEYAGSGYLQTVEQSAESRSSYAEAASLTNRVSKRKKTLVNQCLFQQAFLPVSNLAGALQKFSQVFRRMHI